MESYYHINRVDNLSEYYSNWTNVLYWEAHNPSFITFKELINSGKLSSLSNESIKQLLLKVDYSYNELFELRKHMYDDYSDYLYKPFADIIDYENSIDDLVVKVLIFGNEKSVDGGAGRDGIDICGIADEDVSAHAGERTGREVATGGQVDLIGIVIDPGSPDVFLGRVKTDSRAVQIQFKIAAGTRGASRTVKDKQVFIAAFKIAAFSDPRSNHPLMDDEDYSSMRSALQDPNNFGSGDVLERESELRANQVDGGRPGHDDFRAVDLLMLLVVVSPGK